MRLDIHHHLAGDLLAELGAIHRKLDLILKRQEIEMSAITDALDKAEASAKANSDAEDAVMGLLTTLSAQIAALKTTQTDPATVARVQALADALSAKAAALSAAVVANTPAA
jgi:hypothetical protein